MYSTVIEIKRSVTGEALAQLRRVAEAAFSNRAGSVKNSSRDSHRLVFEGGEEDYGCLDLGVAELARVDGVLGQVDKWEWIDYVEPEEGCDILEVYAEPVR